MAVNKFRNINSVLGAACLPGYPGYVAGFGCPCKARRLPADSLLPLDEHSAPTDYFEKRAKRRGATRLVLQLGEA